MKSATQKQANALLVSFPKTGLMIVISMLTVLVASRLLPHIAFLVLVPLVLLVTIAAFTRRVYAQEGRSEAVSYVAGALLFVGVGYVISLCL